MNDQDWINLARANVKVQQRVRKTKPDNQQQDQACCEELGLEENSMRIFPRRVVLGSGCVVLRGGSGHLVLGGAR